MLQIEAFVLDQTTLGLNVAPAPLRQQRGGDVVITVRNRDVRESKYRDVVVVLQGVPGKRAKQAAVGPRGFLGGPRGAYRVAISSRTRLRIIHLKD